MELAELRAELEEDLQWRFDELRLLRNQLLGSLPEHDWSVSSLRTLLVMQYAHLEGFTQMALGAYVKAINDAEVYFRDLKPELAAVSLAQDFRAIRSTVIDPDSGAEDHLLRRAQRETRFVSKVRNMGDLKFLVEPESAVELEMNLGTRVLKKALFVLGIPHTSFSNDTFGSLDFLRRSRNDIAHGQRVERIEPSVFTKHRLKCEEYMNDLARVITDAVRAEMYRHDPESAS